MGAKLDTPLKDLQQVNSYQRICHIRSGIVFLKCRRQGMPAHW